MSGNAGLAGPGAAPGSDVLAADQKDQPRGREQLKKAGLEGGMDQLRARAYMDLLLGTDSRPRQDSGPDNPGPDNPGPDNPGPDNPGRDGTGQGNPGQGNPGWDSTGWDGGGGWDGGAVPAGPRTGSAPAGPAAGPAARGDPGRVRREGQSDRPAGHPARSGRPARRDPWYRPHRPWLARDLARAAAQNPRTTFCVTVTDQDGHAIGHGWLKQHPRWNVDQLPDGTFRWTAPSGRQYTAEPTRYPV